MRLGLAPTFLLSITIDTLNEGVAKRYLTLLLDVFWIPSYPESEFIR